MCVNLSGNARSGQAFDLIWRDGRQFHVYGGKGADHTVVEVGKKAAADGHHRGDDDRRHRRGVGTDDAAHRHDRHRHDGRDRHDRRRRPPTRRLHRTSSAGRASS